jgi:phosphoglycerate dehydrogenase-like enzyme
VTDVWMPHVPGGAFRDVLEARLACAVRLHAGDRPPVEGYDVLVAGRPEEDALDASDRLGVVVVPWAGIPPATRERLQARPHLALHNLHHNGTVTGEMAVALLLAAARRIVPLDRALREGDWRPRYREEDRGLLLAGRRLLVLGYGAIGRHVARAGLGLGMHVTAVRRRPQRGGDADVEVHGPDALDDLLATTDALVVCVPSTAATRGLLDADRLARLPRHAVVVNVARGDVIDEEALYRALAEDRLGGAGLDVWYRYPADEAARASTPPSRFPFGDLDTVVLSPHRAGLTDDTERLRAEHLADLLAAVARGGEVPGRVDLEAGY